jgi:hypothetical protein
MKLGDRIEHLTLYIEGTLPPINCRGLKYRVLQGRCGQSREPFEPCPCDLSRLTHLTIRGFSTEQQLLFMKACNIGENLEFMHMDSNPGHAALARTPRLKSLSLRSRGIDMPPHVCPDLLTIYTDSYNERDRPKSQVILYIQLIMRNCSFVMFFTVVVTSICSPRGLLELLLVIGNVLLFVSEVVEPHFCCVMFCCVIFSFASTKKTSIHVHG